MPRDGKLVMTICWLHRGVCGCHKKPDGLRAPGELYLRGAVQSVLFLGNWPVVIHGSSRVPRGWTVLFLGTLLITRSQRCWQYHDSELSKTFLLCFTNLAQAVFPLNIQIIVLDLVYKYADINFSSL